jgi:phosphoglycolate phosphatase-like HAD superfamily hydrolase
MNTGCIYRAVLFDFDGVICDSVDVKTQAFRALYEHHGPDITQAVARYHHEHGGISRYEKIRYYENLIHGTEPDQQTVDHLASKFADLVVQKVIESNYIDGALEALETTSATMSLYVVSGTPEDELQHIVEARRLSDFFDAVYGSPRQKHDIIASIMHDHGYEAGDCLMIGDAMTDYTAAQKTSVDFLGVLSGDHNPFPAGTRVIDDLTMLSNVFNQANTGSITERVNNET